MPRNNPRRLANETNVCLISPGYVRMQLSGGGDGAILCAQTEAHFYL